MFNASQSTTSSAKDSNVSNDKPSNATPKDGVNVKKKDEKKKKKNRCQKCNKKLKLTGKIYLFCKNIGTFSTTKVDLRRQRADRPETINSTLSDHPKILNSTFSDITCRCGGSYCPKDIPSDVHGCTYDYKKQGADEIRKNNPVVAGCKVRKI